MYESAIKATILFEEQKHNEAIEYLESFIRNSPDKDSETIQAYEYLIRFKRELSLDFSVEAEYLMTCSSLDLFSDTLFFIGSYLLKKGDKENAIKYFNTFILCTADWEDYARQMGFIDEWLEVKELTALKKQAKTDDADLHKRCNYGEQIENLSEKEKEFVLCEGFVEEVNSGGLEAYFSTGYSRHCVKTVEYLEKNKSKIYPKILKKAISLFPKNFDFSDPMKTEDYLDEHEKILDKFEKLEEKIYDSDEDIDFILEQLKEQIK